MNQEISGSSNQPISAQQPPQAPVQSQVAQEEQSSYQPEHSEQKEKSKSLAILRVGLFEIIFVLISLILLFGILNYFNILKLSAVFPKYLGFLPHRAYQQSKQPARNASQSDAGGFNNSTMKQSNNVTIVPSPIIPPTERAKETLTSFLPTILSPVLVPDPSQITIKQDKNISTTFVSSWSVKESTVAAIFANTDGQNISQLYLSFQKTQTAQPTILLAQQTTSQFFSMQPKGVWGCKPLYDNTMTYCENFWTDADGTRKGLGMEGLFTQGPNRINGQPEAMLIFCQHSKESKLYSWKSCQFEFAQTGVK